MKKEEIEMKKSKKEKKSKNETSDRIAVMYEEKGKVKCEIVDLKKPKRKKNHT